ncbi:hypothetical protein HYS31_00810 [Candidatus Woesearchaeota archaeon]|nr:hypothetical protein [Candidatus Woesearchaeota archaeon]
MVTKSLMGRREIYKIYQEYYEDETLNEFEEFLSFLEIDLYDWVNENLRQFEYNKNFEPINKR